MRGKVVIIAKSQKASSVICCQLKELLGRYIDFYNYSIEEGVNRRIGCDLCIAPSEDISGDIASKIFPDTKIIPIKRTIKKSEWQKISSLPIGTKALLVNTSREFAIECISFLLEMGANHISLIPYYPGILYVPPNIDTAITPNEVALVPTFVKNVINIGDRTVEPETIFKILSSLNLLRDDEIRNILYEYTMKMIPRSMEWFTLVSGQDTEMALLKRTVLMLGYSVIACDESGMIFFCCSHDRNLCSNSLCGRNIRDVISIDALRSDIDNKTVKINGKVYCIVNERLGNGNKFHGGIFVLSEHRGKLTETDKKPEYALNAKYTFKDIFGRSDTITETIKKAKKAALTDMDILIEGETGTGKELFANAIHNESKRRNGPFIAFNCAAISSSLLESELFGYEEGAFTGAKKGGKKGLLEIADTGTVFLDEIGEIPKDMQVKLLRVLQEREVTHVGGIKRVPIDVRIIAATNKDLIELIKSGEFRSDLYYRLNVMILKIPPLRERHEDLLYMINVLLRNQEQKYDIPDDVIAVLNKYNWPGNIRELSNYCEYIVNMEGEFTADNLPDNIKRYYREQCEQERSGVTADISAAGIGDEEKRVLLTVYELNRTGKHAGRKNISEILKGQSVCLSEQEVRTILLRLKELSFVEIHKGRAGTKITNSGRREAENLMNSLNG